ncbi:hypothetical protein GcC1_088020 [Golovinomyces cichoracearum]|uniref:Uncharacterized protein n=1 Tax=Golovinomyces cichoracearum TaxID=62708 RepID=A0A420IGM5_9PEZI|nr:hypothetical protein GcC1_088020 [Golovinomyces cichoracearum]
MKLPAETTKHTDTLFARHRTKYSQFEGEINSSVSANQLEIPVTAIQVIPPLQATKLENPAPKVPVIPQMNKLPVAIEKLDISSKKKAPTLQKSPSLESDCESVYEDLNDEEEKEEQKTSKKQCR